MTIIRERELLDAFERALKAGDADQARQALIAFYAPLGMY